MLLFVLPSVVPQLEPLLPEFPVFHHVHVFPHVPIVLHPVPVVFHPVPVVFHPVHV